MKNIIILFVSIILIFGCNDNPTSSNNSGGIGGPISGGGNNNNGGVNFTMTHQVLQEGYDFDNDGQQDDSFYLVASPSVSVTITSVKVSIPNNANFDNVQGDASTIYNANDQVQINVQPYYNVSKGLKFTLTFNGSLTSNNNNFTKTVEYIVP